MAKNIYGEDIVGTYEEDLVRRLRGVIVIPVNDGCGLLDGKDTFTRDFSAHAPPIQKEAANLIEGLLARLKVYE